MKISFHGASGSVTGSCFLVEYDETRFLVDCGMFQGNKTLKKNNYGTFGFAPDQIDFVLVTHAHIDHTGLLPKLVKHGFKGPIYATHPTVGFLKFLLPDSARIQESEVEQKNRRLARKGENLLEPIYTEADAEACLTRFKGVGLEELCKPAPGCSAVFRNAGHILGSAFIEIELEENGKKKKIVFSGDLGEKDHPIVKDPETPHATDYLVIESTYGARPREKQDKNARLQEIARIIKETHARGGNLVVPAFALERTQDLMHDISILMGRKEIPDIEVVIDSPLAIKLTKVFSEYPEHFDEDARKIIKDQGELFQHPRFRFTLEAKDSMALNGQTGLVLLSASGMADAGRIKHHLKHNLWRPECTVLFVGYQAEGTLGRLLLDGAKRVRIHGEEVQVRARIEKIVGYSGHADQNGILDWFAAIPEIRERVFIVHGEDESRAELAKLLLTKKQVEVVRPNLGDEFDLLVGKPVAQPTVVAQPLDSHNQYADLMLKLAGFMRGDTAESARQGVLKKILEILPGN